MSFYKVCLLGSVDKTTLRNRFMGRGFREEHLMTIGADFATFDMTVDYEKVTFQIWDVARGESMKDARRRFYNGQLAGILVYDVNVRQSFMDLTMWITELWKNSGRGVVPLAILALESDNRQEDSVPVEQGEKYATQLTEKMQSSGKNFHVKHFETSAQTGLNVEAAFTDLGRQITEAIKSGDIKLLGR